MTTKESGPRATEIAETFINGNRTDAVQAVADKAEPLAAAAFALCVFECLRGMGGIHTANSFRAAIERRMP